MKVEPASLRDPQFAASCAERAVALSHRQSPSALLTLAQAYRASGQIGEEPRNGQRRAGAAAGPAAGRREAHLRKLLEIQAQTVG